MHDEHVDHSNVAQLKDAMEEVWEQLFQEAAGRVFWREQGLTEVELPHA